MKILYLITKPEWAGAQKVLYTIVKGIRGNYPNKVSVEVATGPNGPLIQYLRDIGIKVHIIPDLVHPLNPAKDIKAFLSIRKLLNHGKYDILHLHCSKAALLGSISAKTGFNRILSVRTIHGFWPQCPEYGIKGVIFLQIEKIFASLLDQMVFVCQKDLEKAKRWKLGDSNNYTLIYNAIEAPEKCKTFLRKELDIPLKVKIVGNVARLDKQKNPSRFLEVARIILQNRQDVVFVWIGDSTNPPGRYKQMMEIVNGDELLKGKIHFMGHRDNAANLINDFDVFLLTSESEGLPLVILEARSFGVPIVSTDIGGISEIIGDLGILCSLRKDSDCIRDLAEGVETQLSRKRERTRSTMGPQKMVADHIQLYENLSSSLQTIEEGANSR